MAEPNLTSVAPPTRRWGMRVEGGDQLVLYVDEVNPDTYWLTVGLEQAVPRARVRLDQVQLRALGAAARMLSGTEHEDAEVIRRDERERLAQLLEENASTLAGFVPHPAAAVGLVVLLLRLNNPTET